VATEAVKLAVVALAATVTDAGTVTDASLLERLTLKPPLRAAAFNVTVHVSVPAPVIDPLAQVSALSVTTGLSCNAKVSETLPEVAVNVAVLAVLKAETEAVKLAVVAFAATDIEAGTVTVGSLLERFTVNPPLGAALLSVTVHASVPAPVIDPLTHLNPVNVGAAALPVPLNATTVCGPVEELLAIVTWPVTEPALIGSNCTVNDAVWPGFSVAGKLAPRIENPAPLSVTELTVSAAVPVDLSVTVCVAAVFSVMLPNPIVLALKVKVGASAVSCNANVFETPVALAVKVAV
jgi:hypothetical protein